MKLGDIYLVGLPQIGGREPDGDASCNNCTRRGI